MRRPEATALELVERLERMERRLQELMRERPAYYSPARVAAALDFSTKWVIAKVKAGEFGPDCRLINADYRIPATGLASFLERHHLRPVQTSVRAK